jgi:Ca2+-dependent lipid-binding protein
MSSMPFIKIIDLCFVDPPKIDFILKPLKTMDIMDVRKLQNLLLRCPGYQTG